MRSFRTLIVFGITAVLAGCGTSMDLTESALDVERLSDPAEAAEAELRADATYDSVFTAAGREFGVPPAVLKSISFAQTRYEHVQGHVEFEGRPASVGVMGLSETHLAEAAELIGATPEQIREDPAQNVRAAAALLNAWGSELGVERSDVRNWAPAVAELLDLDDAEAQRAFVADEVFHTLRLGVGEPSAELAQSGMALSLELEGELGTSQQELSTAPDYSKAVWRPSPNYNARPAGNIGKPGMVIIHTCEGAYSGCWGWLSNKAAGASAHYVVNSNGSEISQLVRESQRAWHIAANYACSNNSSVECWRNGYSSNHFTIGIEHAGYASQKTFPTGQIDASAQLVCNITKKYGIARDRYHIVGHGKLQPWNRTDPGPNWPWTTYLNKVNSYCGSGGGGTTSPTIIVDSNNGNNDQKKGYIQVSSNWTSTHSTAGYYGTGYYYANTAAVSDGATFWFYLPKAEKRTIDAWWTAGTNRSPSAPFVMFNAQGTKLGTVNANQQVNGKKWVTLGSFNFSAGWNKVVLSRWTGTGKVVIADAVRIR